METKKVIIVLPRAVFDLKEALEDAHQKRLIEIFTRRQLVEYWHQ